MLWYCGFDAFLQFRQKPEPGVHLHSLGDLILDDHDKIINAFIGWCSLFLQTAKGQIIFLGYSKQKRQNGMTVCAKVPKYIIQIECGSKETFLITSGFNFEKTLPELIEFSNHTKNDADEKEENVNVEQVCIGAEYSCIITDQHRAFLFDSNELRLIKPISPENDRIIAISAGQEHILLLSEAGVVLSYGNGSRGQLGHGSISNIVDDRAEIVEALEGIPCKAIIAGGWHSLALSEIGDVYVWGWNESSQLGFGRDTIKIEATPKLLDISEDDRFVAIAAGSRHSMAVSENGILFGWGWNKYGQLGIDSTAIEFADSPTVIPFDHKVSNVYCRFWSSLVETENSDDGHDTIIK
ncbi:Regulator of chromosome condensation (RCC1) repeat protein [Euroglyphus maynei]|uniref:Regulator of chromosome condensation (RCC1) repeat protein n=1 Tax=Euroglyphus maynei TaxID=6958 RepID=A0A1Y3AZR1_EURMA|nr:Regulator of chromosome condensation (RCC1) repeat protein [Euroglyphus maynei]